MVVGNDKYNKVYDVGHALIPTNIFVPHKHFDNVMPLVQYHIIIYLFMIDLKK